MAEGPRRRLRGSGAGKRGWFPWLVGWAILRLPHLLLLLAALDIFYLSRIWPDFDALAAGPAPVSAYIQQHRVEHPEETLHWVPVGRRGQSATVRRVVVASEDARFRQHYGVDWQAVRDAARENWEAGRIVRGASTISQQTARNLFLHGGQNFLRKWHELVLALALEWHLDKGRILTLYLDIAEFGPGIYGVEAAARHYWGISASRLGYYRSLELAATLPSPRWHNPATRTAAFHGRLSALRQRVRPFP